MATISFPSIFTIRLFSQFPSFLSFSFPSLSCSSPAFGAYSFIPSLFFFYSLPSIRVYGGNGIEKIDEINDGRKKEKADGNSKWNRKSRVFIYLFMEKGIIFENYFFYLINIFIINPNTNTNIIFYVHVQCTHYWINPLKEAISYIICWIWIRLIFPSQMDQRLSPIN